MYVNIITVLLSKSKHNERTRIRYLILHKYRTFDKSKRLGCTVFLLVVRTLLVGITQSLLFIFNQQMAFVTLSLFVSDNINYVLTSRIGNTSKTVQTN